jgi:hypothetical protein
MARKFRPYNPAENDWEREELKGKVLQLMQTTYKAHGKGDMVFPGKIEVSYGDEDNFIKRYNDKGLRIEHTSFGTLGYKTHTYDEGHKQLVETKEFNKDGSLRSSHVYHYKPDGKPNEFFYYDKDGNVASHIVFEYDSEGREIKQSTYHGTEKKLYGWYERTYNEFGKQLSYISYKMDGTIDFSSHCTYNEKGHLVETVDKRNKDPKSTYVFNERIVYRPNEYGDSVETTFYKSDGTSVTYHNDYEYDSEGKKILKPRVQEEETKEAETEKNEFDSQGNWSRKTIFYNKLPVKMLVREIVYFGEEEKKFVHPMLNEKAEVEEANELKFTFDEFSEQNAKWLTDGKDVVAEQFPTLRYYLMTFKEYPSLVNYTGPYIEAESLLKALKESCDAKELHTYNTNYDRRGNQMIRYTLMFPRNDGYLLQANHISAHDADEYEVPEFVKDYDGYVYTSQFSFFCPGEHSENKDSYFEEEIEEFIGKHSLRKKPDKPVINIIQMNNNGFVMNEHPVDNNFQIADLDVNYGQGFNKFHQDLVHRFNTTTKGLVLFHGQPGTGKTYYIRHLLRNMVLAKKVVIYMPPNMVDHLVDPGFMAFLSGEVQDFSENNQSCVLLIEDAEPLLAKRQEGVRIQGITNLLNMSDGLLNDMLKLQVICTFNVDLRKLDSALLRPGRLIARKEFKALPELDANLLAQRLGIKHHFTGPATLGEIYSLRKNKDTLIHDVESDKGASTLLDDLL